MTPVIKITIHKDGSVETEISGVKGTGCTALIDAITTRIGETTEDSPTSDFYDESVECDHEYV